MVTRFDFDGIDTAVADQLMADLEQNLSSFEGKTYNTYKVSEAKPFIYHDVVDGSVTKNGLLVYFEGGHRICYRLSGTGTNGATLRVYIESYDQKDFDKNPVEVLTPLLNVAMILAEIEKRTGKNKPDLTT